MSWLGIDISIKGSMLKLVLCAHMPSFSEMMRQWKCFLHCEQNANCVNILLQSYLHGQDRS